MAVEDKFYEALYDHIKAIPNENSNDRDQGISQLKNLFSQLIPLESSGGGGDDEGAYLGIWDLDDEPDEMFPDGADLPATLSKGAYVIIKNTENEVSSIFGALESGDRLTALVDNAGNVESEWLKEAPPISDIEGSAIKSTGEAGGTKVLTENGSGGAAWVEPAGGGSDVKVLMLDADVDMFSLGGSLTDLKFTAEVGKTYGFRWNLWITATGTISTGQIKMENNAGDISNGQGRMVSAGVDFTHENSQDAEATISFTSTGNKLQETFGMITPTVAEEIGVWLNFINPGVGGEVRTLLKGSSLHYWEV